jgi:hypothetical protein
MKKAVIRRVGHTIVRRVRRVREWLEEVDPRSLENAPSAYPWLNAIHLQISRLGGETIRPDYLWGALHGCYLAKTLSIDAVSLIEFGVAGGNGLVSLDVIARHVSRALGVSISVYGFDTGRGLPPPQDLRDCPNLFAEGDYKMDVAKLQQRLSVAKLNLGLVEDTVPTFIASRPDPVAFVSFDLDFYTSTNHALQLLQADTAMLLPRIHCYFDDITGYTYAPFNGERLSIAEYNEQNASRKIAPIYAARHYVPNRWKDAIWTEKLYLAHILDHPMYNKRDGLTRIAIRDLR